MRKQNVVFVFAILLCCCLGAFSQNNVVTHYPQQTQGYLVLTKDNYPSVKKWRVEVLQKDVTMKNGAETVVASYMLSGNFVRIPDLYWHETGSTSYNYTLKITGLDKAEAPVVNVPKTVLGPPGVRTDYCSAFCNGTDYAWKLDFYSYTSGNGSTQRMDLLPLTANYNAESGIVTPLYQFMPATEYLNIIMANNQLGIERRQHYNLSNIHQTNLINGWVVHLPNVTINDNILDKDGLTLIGDVYGVQKTMGKWQGYDIHKSPTTLTQSDCVNGLSYLINYVNQNFDIFKPNGAFANNPLECNPTLGTSGYPDWENESAGGTAILICGDEITEFEFGMGPDAGTIYDFAAALEECENGNGGGIGTPGSGFHWPSAVADVTFAQIDKPGLSVVLSETSIFNERGELNAPAFTSDPGLYRMGIRFNDNSILPLYFKIENTVTHSLKQANMLSAKVFPVPISSNTFSIELTSSANVMADYRVYGPGAELLYTTSVALTKDVKQTLVVTPAHIPSGLILHQFTFPDGSTTAFTTLSMQ